MQIILELLSQRNCFCLFTVSFAQVICNHSCYIRLFIAIYNMEIVTLVYSAYFDYRKKHVVYVILLYVPLKHSSEQSTSVLLRRHCILRCSRNRVNEVTVITYDYVLVPKEKIGDRLFNSSQNSMPCSVPTLKSSQIYTD